MYTVKLYTPKLKNDIINFLEKVLPESGRKLDLEGRHCFLMHIPDEYDKFWCLYDGERLIGTVGIKRITEQKCELKHCIYTVGIMDKDWDISYYQQQLGTQKRLDIWRCILIHCLPQKEPFIYMSQWDLH